MIINLIFTNVNIAINRIINEEIKKSLLIFETPRFKKEIPNQEFSLRQNDWHKKLDAYKNDPWAFVTFSSIPKLGINPTNVYQTPTGIYAYPLYEGLESNKINNFATERPYAIVFRPNNPDKILDLGKYTEENYQKDKQILMNLLPDDVLYTESERSALFQSPAGYIWNLVRLLSRREELRLYSKDLPINGPFQWNQIMYNILGYEGVYDSMGLGIIHKNEPYQAVFFRTNVVQLVELINKTDKEDFNKRGLISNMNLDWQKIRPAVLYATGKSSTTIRSLSDMTINFSIYQDKKLAFKDIELSHIKFSDGKMSDFHSENVEFINCEFKVVNLQKSNFINCKFENCEFKLVNLQKSNFINCKFENCVFESDFDRSVSFDSCNFFNSQFIGSNVFFHYSNKMVFDKCLFDGYTTLNPVEKTRKPKKAEYNNCKFFDVKIYLDTLKTFMKLDETSIQSLIQSNEKKIIKIGLSGSYMSQDELFKQLTDYLNSLINQ